MGSCRILEDCRIPWDSVWLHRILQDFIKDSIGFGRLMSDSIGFDRIPHVSIGFCVILLGSIGLFRIL